MLRRGCAVGLQPRRWKYFDIICHNRKEKGDEKFYKTEYLSGTIEYNKLLRKEVPHV